MQTRISIIAGYLNKEAVTQLDMEKDVDSVMDSLVNEKLTDSQAKRKITILKKKYDFYGLDVDKYLGQQRKK